MILVRERSAGLRPTPSLLHGIDLELCLLLFLSLSRDTMCNSATVTVTGAAAITRADTPARPAVSTRDRDTCLVPGFRTLCLSEAGSIGSASVYFAERTALSCAFGECNRSFLHLSQRGLCAAEVFSGYQPLGAAATLRAGPVADTSGLDFNNTASAVCAAKISTGDTGNM